MIGILAEDAEAYAAELEGLGDELVVTTDPDELVTRGEGLQVLLADPRLAVEVLSRLPQLRWVQSTWAGMDALCAAPIPAGVTVTKVVDLFGPQIREFVLCYLLVWERRVFNRLATQRGRRWTPPDHGTLAGKTLGVMGTGSIGRAVARAARCLDMRVRGLNRSGNPAEGFDHVVTDPLSFADGIDHLVVTLPGTDATEGLVDSEVLSRLGPGSVLINVGRGSVVDTDAVVAALEGGRLAMAVLDVLPTEPLGEDSPLWDVPNLHITSHTAAPSIPAEVAGLFRDNLARWRAGEPLRGVVDPEEGY